MIARYVLVLVCCALAFATSRRALRSLCGPRAAGDGRLLPARRGPVPPRQE